MLEPGSSILDFFLADLRVGSDGSPLDERFIILTVVVECGELGLTKHD
jgi:hypothetical protein